MSHKITLTDDEHQNLERLAVYCGYLRKDKRLGVSDAPAFLRAIAALPPDKWDDLRAILAQAAKSPEL